jgi:hypothetical protein
MKQLTFGGVAQLVRACGSYPQCPGFKSLHRHQRDCTLSVKAGAKKEWLRLTSVALLIFSAEANYADI